MRRLLFAAVAIGIVLSAGVSSAQEVAIKPMPDKVHKFLDGMTGTWNSENPEDGTAGRLLTRWAPGRHCITAEAQDKGPKGVFTISVLLGWDKVTENGVYLSAVSSTSHATLNMKVISDTVMEGEGTGYILGQKTVEKLRIVKQGPNQFTHYFTLKMGDEQKQSNSKTVFTRVKPTTREDFAEFCRLTGGRWVGEIKWAADWPGVGKKGDIVTVYRQNNISQDGNAQICQWFAGNGSSSLLFSYDAEAQIIKGMRVSSGGSLSQITFQKRNGGWIWNVDGVELDGTIVKLVGTSEFTNNGSALTEKGNGTRGDEKGEFTDVWKKVSK